MSKSAKKHEEFPIVAIGASAGGLEAISKLLEALSPELGMAYVIIQHLSPTHQSILPELLERKTRMKVLQVEDGMHVHPDSVYVIPPNSYVSIVDSKLTLSPRVKTEGGYHSIDHFLMALAPIYQNKAIAVILSGTATDGTEGVRAIKAEGGITFAQDETAKFRGMPDNAAQSGLVDFVLPPEKIAHELETIARFPYSETALLNDISVRDQELRKIHQLLYKQWSVDFSNYKQTTITRRIFRRMTLNKITTLEEYAQFLGKNTTELKLLYQDMLISVTSFFREPALYEALSQEILPEVLKERKQGDSIRIWIPACSTGEEVYSIAICLFEFLNERSIVCPIQIFGTDLSAGAIAKARAAVYNQESFDRISQERQEKFFVRLNGHFQVIKPIRDVCVFATHNLLKDPPFSKVDLISCQNVLIYLEAPAQKRILQSFHYALKPSGYLLLGKSESIGKATELFTSTDKNFKVYAKNANPNLHFNFASPSGFDTPATTEYQKKMAVEQRLDPDIDRDAEKILLTRYVPASVTVNKDLQVLQFYGPTFQYIHPATGKASFHLLKMLRDELLFDVRALLQQVKKDGIPAKKEGVLLAIEGKEKEICIEVVPLRNFSKTPNYLILFKEEGPVTGNGPTAGTLSKAEIEDARDLRNKSLEQELQNSRQQLKLITEESEATQEELQSANEEILSSNEELQSINEELETSKEELQSTNEELMTINEELQTRNFDLKEAGEYSEAIIQTMTEPLIVLNPEMRVSTANKAFYNLFRLKANEVENSYFFEMGFGQWNFAELRNKLNSIIHDDNGAGHFELTRDFPNIGVKTLSINTVRMSQDSWKNRRFLLLIQDITDRIAYLQKLNFNKEYFRLLVQNAFDIITIFSADGTIQYQSESIERVLGYLPEQRVGTNIFVDSILHPDDLNLKREMFNRSLAAPDKPITQEFRLRHKDGSYRDIEAVCMNLLDNEYIRGVIGIYRDITVQRVVERQREEFIAVASHELKTPVTSIKGYAQLIQQALVQTDEKDVTELIKKLNDRVNRLTHLVGNLLDVTKISSGHLQLQLSTFDLNRLITEIIEEAQQTTSIRIISELHTLEEVTGDWERIGQVMTNFLSNAIKYSPDTDKIIVRTSFSEHPASNVREISVSVEDFGMGINDKEQQIVFERYFRARNSNTNTIPGLGLGLYISAQIIRRHGWTIWVRSKKNEGSVFGFTIPLPAEQYRMA
ncbi:MAG TPA: chemotaxis protein CheB [Puia sp.]